MSYKTFFFFSAERGEKKGCMVTQNKFDSAYVKWTNLQQILSSDNRKQIHAVLPWPLYMEI